MNSGGALGMSLPLRPAGAIRKFPKKAEIVTVPDRHRRRLSSMQRRIQIMLKAGIE